MRSLRLLALPLLVALAASVGLVSPAAAATATQLSIEGAPRLGIFHDEIGPKTADVVRHRGQLTTTGDEPVDGATVMLERQLRGSGEWVEVEEDTTNAEGTYRFFTHIVGNARYRVSYAGDAVYDPSTSAEAPLGAMRDFNAVLEEKERSAVLKGNINPGWDGKVVRWQKRTCTSCPWRTVDRERSGENGSWSFRGDYPPAGKKWFYRAAIDGTTDFVKSVSAMLITTRER